MSWVPASSGGGSPPSAERSGRASRRRVLPIPRQPPQHIPAAKPTTRAATTRPAPPPATGSTSASDEVRTFVSHRRSPRWTDGAAPSEWRQVASGDRRHRGSPDAELPILDGPGAHRHDPRGRLEISSFTCRYRRPHWGCRHHRCQTRYLPRLLWPAPDFRSGAWATLSARSKEGEGQHGDPPATVSISVSDRLRTS